MYLALVFWFALALPGYAVVCRFDRKQLNSGFFGTLSLSYLAALALLSPIAILGYVLGLPLTVLSSACVLLVVFGVLEITRRGRWRSAGALLLSAISVELLIVVVDLLLGARVGSVVGADAITHLARIRFVLDHGLSNADPFVGGYFFPTYHTNLLHALCAACSQLTGVDHFGVWFVSLVWAKLVVAGGTYYLAWSVFRRAWPAWVAVVFVVGTQGPITFMLYPNKLAPFWLIAMLLGFGVRAVVAPTRKSIVWIAAGTLVIGQIHALYAGFALVLLGPVLIARAIPLLVRRRRLARRLLLGTLVLGIALPFAWASKAGEWGRPQAPRGSGYQGGVGSFVRVGAGWQVKDPWTGFGGGAGRRYLWLAGGILLGLAGTRRREVVWLSSSLLVAATIFFTPPLCTAALAVLGAAWVLLRLEIVYFVAFPVLVPAAAAYACERWRPRYWLCAAASVALFVAAIPYAPHSRSYNWDRYRRLAALSSPRRHGNLTNLRQLAALLERHVPAGSTVLVEPRLGMRLVAAYDCRLIAPGSGGSGIPRRWERRAEAEELLWGGPLPVREQLLDAYGIRFLFGRELPGWARGRTDYRGTSPFGRLWHLRTPGPADDRPGSAPEGGQGQDLPAPSRAIHP